MSLACLWHEGSQGYEGRQQHDGNQQYENSYLVGCATGVQRGHMQDSLHAHSLADRSTAVGRSLTW